MVRELSKLSDFTYPYLSCSRWEKGEKKAFLRKECHLSEFSIGQDQIKAEKLRRKSFSVSQTVCPTCSLQVNAGICMPISPLQQLWIYKLNSFLLMCSQSLLPHAHCLHHLWLLSRKGHLTTQTLLIWKNYPALLHLKFMSSLLHVFWVTPKVKNRSEGNN